MSQDVLTAFMHALRQMLLPQVLGMTVLPLVLMGALAALAGWLWWAQAVALMQAWLQGWWLIGWADGWLTAGSGQLAAWLAPALVLALAVPLGVLLVLLAVSLALTPRLVTLVALRRFPHLARRGTDGLWAGLWWTARAVLLALGLFVLSLPLWLLPPLAVLLPPLIGGWLTYRVMSYDALAAHASPAEMAAVLQRHRWPLLLMGVLTGLLGAAPGLVWLSGLLSVALFVVLVPLTVWIYTAVFVLSSLWYAHYCLQALERWRGRAPQAGFAAASPSPAGPGPQAIPSLPHDPHA